MARGTNLLTLLTSLRAETHTSQNPAHNSQVRDEQINLLQRTQEYLWEEFAWPHLRVHREYPLQAGERYYDFNADFDLERIDTIEVKYGGLWCPLGYGIKPAHYFEWDSDLGQRSWPVRRAQISEDQQVEIWPIPDQNGDPATEEGFLRVWGIRKLSPLADDGDTADLDDRLIVLYAAAETLGGRGAKDAQVKLTMAQNRFARLRGRLTKQTSFRMFSIGDEQAALKRPFIGSYRPPISVT